MTSAERDTTRLAGFVLTVAVALYADFATVYVCVRTCVRARQGTERKGPSGVQGRVCMCVRDAVAEKVITRAQHSVWERTEV